MIVSRGGIFRRGRVPTPNRAARRLNDNSVRRDGGGNGGESQGLDLIARDLNRTRLGRSCAGEMRQRLGEIKIWV